MNEQDLYLRGIFSWISIKQITLTYEKQNRDSFGRMLQLALSGITSFSTKPLKLSLLVGVFFAILAFMYGIYAIVVLALDLALFGWTSIIASGLFLSGVQLIVVEVMGEYLGKMYISP